MQLPSRDRVVRQECRGARQVATDPALAAVDVEGHLTSGRELVVMLGGVGSTSFNEQKSQTINLGFGLKLLLGDRAAVRLDVRDHLFSLDLLGKRESTQNLEVTAGVGWHF